MNYFVATGTDSVIFIERLCFTGVTDVLFVTGVADGIVAFTTAVLVCVVGATDGWETAI